MSEDTVVCPSCDGRKRGLCLIDGVKNGRRTGWQEVRDCPFCAGTGKVFRGAYDRYTKGRAMREDRVRRGVSQREEAERLGITPQELNHLEQGRVKP